ncbi:hypothetical protein IAT40_007905 [Kwoniella sp. CBS 6097]
MSLPGHRSSLAKEAETDHPYPSTPDTTHYTNSHPTSNPGTVPDASSAPSVVDFAQVARTDTATDNKGKGRVTEDADIGAEFGLGRVTPTDSTRLLKDSAALKLLNAFGTSVSQAKAALEAFEKSPRSREKGSERIRRNLQRDFEIAKTNLRSYDDQLEAFFSGGSLANQQRRGSDTQSNPHFEMRSRSKTDPVASASTTKSSTLSRIFKDMLPGRRGSTNHSGTDK